MNPLNDLSPQQLASIFDNESVYADLSQSELVDLLCGILNEEKSNLADLTYAFAPVAASPTAPAVVYQAVALGEVLNDIAKLRHLVRQASALELSSNINIAKINTKTGQVFADVIKPSSIALNNLIEEIGLEDAQLIQRSDEERLKALAEIQKQSKIDNLILELGNEDTPAIADAEEEVFVETEKPEAKPSTGLDKLKGKIKPRESSETTGIPINTSQNLAKQILFDKGVQETRRLEERKIKRREEKKQQQIKEDNQKIELQEERLKASEEDRIDIQESVDLGELDKEIIDDKLNKLEDQ